MYPIILLLLSFVISNHGSFFQEALRTASCLTTCQNKTCQEGCDQPMSAFDAFSPMINDNARANVSLHCTGVNRMIIKQTPGIYVIEQSESDSAWNIVKVSKGSFASFINLTAGTRYRYRLHRLTNEGFSRPEISESFSTYETDYEPLEVKSIELLQILPNEQDVYPLRAEISFEPADDRSCTYDVLSWSGDHGLANFRLRMIHQFRFKLTHLNYNQNNTVSIFSKTESEIETSKNTSFTFVTPSCIEVHNNLSICAPEQVEGLRAEHTYRQGNSYDIQISWDPPAQEPDNYTIQVDNELNLYWLYVPGNATEASFLNLQLGPRYEVSIVAESLGGTSSASSIIKSVADEHSTHKLYKEIIIGISILMFFVIIIGGICVQRYMQKNKHLNMEYTNFESFERKNLVIGVEEKQRQYMVESIRTSLLCDKLQIYPEFLKLKGILGSGAYGIVRLGSLQDEFGNTMDVAVKMLKDDPSAEDIKNFHQEIVMMKSAKQHPNIVSLIGCCSLYNQPLLVVEYCSKGDLQKYLRTIWQNMVSIASGKTRMRIDTEASNDNGIDYFLNTSGGNEPNYENAHIINDQNVHMINYLYDIQQDVQSSENVTASDLLSFARQVARGMEFLSQNRIIHRDLAARNVLVCADKVVKISDFGLSRDIYQENLYRKQGNGKLPLKWMAIEALTHQIYTTHSDVWSFGILLWEIVTLGALPYPGIPADRILKLLKSGYRMERPLNCSIALYNIMYACWNAQPQSRPTFTELEDKLDKLLSTLSENKYLNVSDILQYVDD